jgi:hypothetical protein
MDGDHKFARSETFISSVLWAVRWAVLPWDYPRESPT